ncbi:MAG: hypothetical protein AMJ75_00045 [Phycisphaerae bacterium SM1_79]|nr:MAG: hypothetical protein AMJ75_00045 [Phycisphaerae bacterium SM1_79]
MALSLHISTPAFSYKIQASTRDLPVEAMLKKVTTYICFSVLYRISGDHAQNAHNKADWWRNRPLWIGSPIWPEEADSEGKFLYILPIRAIRRPY